MAATVGPVFYIDDGRNFEPVDIRGALPATPAWAMQAGWAPHTTQARRINRRPSKKEPVDAVEEAMKAVDEFELKSDSSDTNLSCDTYGGRSGGATAATGKSGGGSAAFADGRPVPPPPAPYRTGGRSSGGASAVSNGASGGGTAADGRNRRLLAPSRGSKNHFLGRCNPCRECFSPEGCKHGKACNFCHYHHDANRILELEWARSKAAIKTALLAEGREKVVASTVTSAPGETYSQEEPVYIVISDRPVPPDTPPDTPLAHSCGSSSYGEAAQ